MADQHLTNAIYADAPISVVMRNNMVRIEFGQETTPPDAVEGQEPVLVPSHQLVLPLDGMLKLISVSQQVLDRLKAAGVVQPQGEAPIA